MTIQKKTALIFTCITAVILLLTSGVAYFFMNRFGFQDFYKRLEIRAIMTAKAQLEQHRENAGEIYSAIREQHLEPLSGEVEYFFPAVSLQAFIKSNKAPELSDEFYQALQGGKFANQRNGSFFYTGVYYYDAHKPYVAIVGAENIDSVAYSRKLRWILVACCLTGIIVAYRSGIFFSRHACKPVREIINKAKTIEVENLHLRLEETKGEDEIAELTATINDMLSRLETAFETQNNFVSNASHEFRTPLTAIYVEAEVAISRQREKEDYRHSLEVILQQAEKLQQLTDSLLNLAQTGFDGKSQNMQPIHIDELLRDVKDTINRMVPGNDVRFTLVNMPENGLVVIGNYQLLKLGLSNVIENACKYSDNNAVSIKVSMDAGKLQIVVIDKGIGIPERELKYIYDPFFRASNTGKYRGYGIGLPLTRNIFRLHKGEILVQSQGGGTQVTLTLPVSPVA